MMVDLLLRGLIRLPDLINRHAALDFLGSTFRNADDLRLIGTRTKPLSRNWCLCRMMYVELLCGNCEQERRSNDRDHLILMTGGFNDRPIYMLRQRLYEEMRIKDLQPKTQTMFQRGKGNFTRFVGHLPDTATPEELRAIPPMMVQPWEFQSALTRTPTRCLKFGDVSH